MPIRTNSVDVYKMYGNGYAVDIFSKKQRATIVKDNASRIANDIKINHFTELVFDTIDLMSPVIQKHPKLGKIILNSGEKLIKLTGNIPR